LYTNIVINGHIIELPTELIRLATKNALISLGYVDSHLTVVPPYISHLNDERKIEDYNSMSKNRKTVKITLHKKELPIHQSDRKSAEVSN
jgi:hypothetical protein